MLSADFRSEIVPLQPLGGAFSLVALQFECSVHETPADAKGGFDAVAELHLLKRCEPFEAFDERDGFAASAFAFMGDSEQRPFFRESALFQFPLGIL